MKRRKLLRKKKMLEQKLLGIGLLIVCVMVFLIALNGVAFEMRDVSPISLLIPLGIHLMFTDECWIL